MIPSRGFTLIETLVAVMLLAITIVLPYMAIQRSLIATYSARDNLVASAIAQEGIEFVRGVRDNAYLRNTANPVASAAWSGAFGSCKLNDCAIDFYYDSLSVCPAGGCAGKLHLADSGLYTQAVTEEATRFTRYIEVLEETPTYMKVRATVTWQYHGARSLTVTETLYNWP